jgi:hypothetical protein
MSGLADDMQTSTEITSMRILNRLLDENSKQFHTEINAPHPMTTFDTVEAFARDEFGEDFAELLHTWGDKFRTNMIAKNRGRAKELIEGIKAELVREERELRDRMLGSMAR